MENKQVCVIHLCWFTHRNKTVELFTKSYNSFDAGIEHKLAIIFKDFPSEAATLEFKNTIALNHTTYEAFNFEGGYDIDAYFFAAKKISCSYLYFLNTSSCILTDNWLLKMYNCLKVDNIGAASATGSWATYTSSVYLQLRWKWEKEKSIVSNLSKYKSLLKNALYWRFFFSSFPSPHIRTNAFMIRREVLLSIKYKRIRKKFDAYKFESGKSGLSEQLIKAGYAIALVNKNGEIFYPQNWNKANVFWQKNQADLMIADNQTEAYNLADENGKNLFSLMAWGEQNKLSSNLNLTSILISDV